MTAALHIDGSQGEGGGQIVRSSLALALVTGRAVSIDNIRAGREKPGLMRQHLTAVKAAATICGGELRGAEIGSQALTFEPQPVRAGKYRFSIGTAGSATLVLQTVLPALLLAEGESELTLEGGTHNQWAPPYDFLHKSYLPLVSRMGPQVTSNLERHGFYPAGGGRFTVQIKPAPRLRGFDLVERGAIVSRATQAMVSNLPLHIAEREIHTLLRKLNWDETCGRALVVEASGPGNVVLADIASEHVTEVFTGFGRTGVKAERVADEVVRQVRRYQLSNVPIGPYLADQWMLPLGISAWQPGASRQRGGTFRTTALSRHATTHLEILRRFLEIEIRVDQHDDGTTLVRLGAS